MSTEASGVTAPGISAEPLLSVRDLAVHFPITRGFFRQRRIGAVRAVDGISFDLRRGETLGLVGESGSGKSTTGRALVRLNQPTSGSICLDGKEILGGESRATGELRRRVQMIFQDPYSSLDPRMTVRTIIGEPLDIHRIGSARERDARVMELLDVVGLPRRSADRYPHQFSGGQRQRIGIARALALKPELVIADEPISALDVSIQAQILNLLSRLQREFALTYLFISHDLAAVRYISGRTMVMYLGRIVESGPSAELHRRPLHPYTVALLSAAPVPDPRVEQGRKRIILTGDMPSPAHPPPGCRFNTRCWLRRRLGNPSECTTKEPVLRETADGHAVACHFAETVDASPEQQMAIGTVG
ncbi:MAG: peptide/nickel transport system ATP-binding protein [Rhodospirillaceae bacterium]|jgi:oligopeptide/dipeptide ABC transporter ATP-binding protein|nr:peptide/nickel transport system ATP-binding protein [Rhodospirillaceae bacterium]